MLTCLPQSLCSWDFRVDGAVAGPAALAFDFFTEQGSISLGNTEFLVRKHGALSGCWTLEHDGALCAEAQKPSVMVRRFEVRAGAVQLTVEARSAFTRCFDLLVEGTVVGTIEPVHSLTRRASIECGPSVPEFAQLFSFWLAVVTWRRTAADSAAT